MNEETYARQRAAYLAREYDEMKEKWAEIIAWSELGYSSSGIAKRVGLESQTVRSYMEDLEAVFGQESLYPIPGDERFVRRSLPGQ